jgi:hypothetical protein
MGDVFYKGRKKPKISGSAGLNQAALFNNGIEWALFRRVCALSSGRFKYLQLGI